MFKDKSIENFKKLILSKTCKKYNQKNNLQMGYSRNVSIIEFSDIEKKRTYSEERYNFYYLFIRDNKNCIN